MSEPSQSRPSVQTDLTALNEKIPLEIVQQRVNEIRNGPAPKEIGPQQYAALHREVYRDLVLQPGIRRGTRYSTYAEDGTANDQRKQTDVLRKVEANETATFDSLNRTGSLRTVNKEEFVRAMAKFHDSLVAANSFSSGTPTVAAMLTEQAAKHNGWEVNMFRSDGTPVEGVGQTQASRLVSLRNEIRPSALPTRARAFEQAMAPGGDRAAALAQHPELRAAIESVQWAELGREPGDPRIAKRVDEMLTKLNAGGIPKETERNAGRDNGKGFELTI